MWVHKNKPQKNNTPLKQPVLRAGRWVDRGGEGNISFIMPLCSKPCISFTHPGLKDLLWSASPLTSLIPYTPTPHSLGSDHVGLLMFWTHQDDVGLRTFVCALSSAGLLLSQMSMWFVPSRSLCSLLMFYTFQIQNSDPSPPLPPQHFVHSLPWVPPQSIYQHLTHIWFISIVSAPPLDGKFCKRRGSICLTLCSILMPDIVFGISTLNN